MEKISNTILGHRFLYLAPEENKSEILDLLHKSYFEEGQDMPDINILLDLAKNLNLGLESIKVNINCRGWQTRNFNGLLLWSEYWNYDGPTVHF